MPRRYELNLTKKRLSNESLSNIYKILFFKKVSNYRTIGNIDITIAMQRPKLAPYIIPMRECLAGIMGVDTDRVSVKATTTEKLGFVGRGEGCEVYATALLISQNA